MGLPYTFADEQVAQGLQLDANFGALGLMAVIRATAVGATTIVLTPIANQPNVNAYQNYQQFGFVAAGAPTGDASIQVLSLGLKPLYDASGIRLTTGGLSPGVFCVVIYNAALASGSGGFQVISSTSAGGGDSRPGSVVVDCTYGTLTTDNFQAIVPVNGADVTVEPSAAILVVGGTPVTDTVNGIVLEGLSAEYTRVLHAQVPGVNTGTANIAGNPFALTFMPTTTGDPPAVIAFGETDALLLSPVFAEINGIMSGQFTLSTGDNTSGSGSTTPGSGIDILTNGSGGFLSFNNNLSFSSQVYGVAGSHTVQLPDTTRAVKVRLWAGGGGGGSGDQIVSGVTINGVAGADGTDTAVTIKTSGSGGPTWLTLSAAGGVGGGAPDIGDIGAPGGAGGVNNTPGSPLDYLNGGGTGGNGVYVAWGSFAMITRWPDGGNGGASGDTPGAKGGNAWYDNSMSEWNLISAENGRGAGGGGGGGLGTPGTVAITHDVSGGGGGGAGQYVESPWFAIPPTDQVRGDGHFEGVTATISIGSPGAGGVAVSPTSNTFSCSYDYTPTEGMDFNFTGGLTITGGSGPTGSTVNVYGIAYANNETQNFSSPLYFWSDIVINGDTVFTGRREETFSTVLTTFPLYFEMIGTALGTIQADTPPDPPAFGINGADGLDGQVIIEILTGSGGY